MSIQIDLKPLELKRVEKGLTKRELARRAGITGGRYAQILREAEEGRVPSPPRLKELCSVVGIEMSELIRSEKAESVA